MNELCVGRLVEATAGHDKGKKFLVTCIISEQVVYISDGYLRILENPKKKKIKHLKQLDAVSKAIQAKLLAGRKVTNSEVRSFIKQNN